MTISKRALPVRENVPELFEDAPPNKVLEGVVMSNMVGLLTQLGQLSKYATEIFHDLTTEAHGTFDRVGNLSKRIENLNDAVPNVERMFRETHPSLFYRNPDSGGHWSAQTGKSGSLFSRESAPISINERRANIAPPPALHLFDRFTDPPSECAKAYSNPDFFIEQWLIAEVARQKASARDKKNRKKKPKKKSAQRHRVRKQVESVQIKNYSSLGAEFEDADVETRPKHQKRQSMPAVPPPSPMPTGNDSLGFDDEETETSEGGQSGEGKSNLGPTPPPFHARSDSSVSFSGNLERTRSDSEIKIDLADVESVRDQKSRAPVHEQKLIPPPAPLAAIVAPAVNISAEAKKAIAERKNAPVPRGPPPPPMSGPPPRSGGPPPPPSGGSRPLAAAPPPMGGMGRGPPRPPGPPPLRVASPPMAGRGVPSAAGVAPPPLAATMAAAAPQSMGPRSNLMSQIQSGNIALRKAPQDRRPKPKEEDGRDALLAAIRKGAVLKKVEKKDDDKPKKGPHAGAPTSIFDILARRQVIAGSDDEGDDSEEEEDDDWD